MSIPRPVVFAGLIGALFIGHALILIEQYNSRKADIRKSKLPKSKLIDKSLITERLA